jgi:protocatechuate 3,4-dioxygenase beta subunit
VKNRVLTRGELLQQCVASGLLMVSPVLPPSSLLALFEAVETGRRKPTPPNQMGPFFKKRAPRRSQLREPGDPGLPLLVSGTIWNTKGEELPNASLQVWHADHQGKYDLAGYRFRAELATTGAGAYRYETILPGHYPDRVAQHIHYAISAPGHRALVTQLYFATDPVFEGNPDQNFVKDPLVESRELIRPVMLLAGKGPVQAAVQFDICLERL